jgi:hypothetical protein
VQQNHHFDEHVHGGGGGGDGGGAPAPAVNLLLHLQSPKEALTQQ